MGGVEDKGEEGGRCDDTGAERERAHVKVQENNRCRQQHLVMLKRRGDDCFVNKEMR